jgi:hypothetical protein
MRKISSSAIMKRAITYIYTHYSVMEVLRTGGSDTFLNSTVKRTAKKESRSGVDIWTLITSQPGKQM